MLLGIGTKSAAHGFIEASLKNSVSSVGAVEYGEASVCSSGDDGGGVNAIATGTRSGLRCMLVKASNSSGEGV